VGSKEVTFAYFHTPKANSDINCHVPLLSTITASVIHINKFSKNNNFI
jgi:hypothetical protein